LKLKTIKFVFYLLLGIILSNAAVYVKLHNFKQVLELSETEDSENTKQLKLKSEPTIDVFPETEIRHFASTNGGFACPTYNESLHIGDSKPETPPPNY